MHNKISRKTRTGVTVALLCALAYLCEFFLRIPVSFLTYDVKDAIIVLAGMALGPLPAVAMAVIIPLLEFVSISGTGVYGLIMNTASSLAFCLPVACVYKYRKTTKTAIFGLIASVFVMVTVMLGMNRWITPIYTGMPVEEVMRLIPKLILPFNLLKAILNSAIVLVLYRSLISALTQVHLIDAPVADAAENLSRRQKIMALIVGMALIAGCVIALFVFPW